MISDKIKLAIALNQRETVSEMIIRLKAMHAEIINQDMMANASPDIMAEIRNQLLTAITVLTDAEGLLLSASEIWESVLISPRNDYEFRTSIAAI